MNTPLPDIRFIYNSDTHLPNHEAVIRNLYRRVSKVISLPDYVEIVFEDLGHSVYGDTKLDHRFLNRVTLNCNLDIRDIPIVLVHELIHVHQSHIGMLKSDSHGVMYWNGQAYKNVNDLTYEQYIRLPWEADVIKNHREILISVLNMHTY